MYLKDKKRYTHMHTHICLKRKIHWDFFLHSDTYLRSANISSPNLKYITTIEMLIKSNSLFKNEKLWRLNRSLVTWFCNVCLLCCWSLFLVHMEYKWNCPNSKQVSFWATLTGLMAKGVLSLHFILTQGCPSGAQSLSVLHLPLKGPIWSFL